MEVEATGTQRYSVDLESLLRREASDADRHETRIGSGPDRVEVSREARERLEEERHAQNVEHNQQTRRRRR